MPMSHKNQQAKRDFEDIYAIQMEVKNFLHMHKIMISTLLIIVDEN